MPQVTIEEAMQIAIGHYQGGRLEDAEAMCREILAIRPQYADALYLLGLKAGKLGENEKAVGLIRQAIAEAPGNPGYYCNLGILLKSSGQVDEAIACYQKALALKPDLAEAHNNLGVALTDRGRVDEAIACYERALRTKPDYPEAQYNLGLTLTEKEEFGEAIECYQRAIAMTPDHAEMHYNLGIALRENGQLDRAIAAFRRSLAICPEARHVLYDMADALMVNGQYDQAMSAYEAEGPAAACGQVAAKTSSAQTGKVFAVCSIRNGGVDLLPHWLEHYSKLGVDQILIGLFDDPTPEVREQIEACAGRWRFGCFRQWWNGSTESSQEEQRRAGCRAAGAGPETWIVHSDLDELHEFPAPLAQIIAAAEGQGIEAIVGWFLDRVAADGSLPAIRPAPPSLFEQFPIGCRLTARVLQGGTQKIMLARLRVEVDSGHHISTSATPGRPPLGRPEQYVVHHFKWHADLLPRLRWSLGQPNTPRRWRQESERFLRWLESNRGKIRLDDNIGMQNELSSSGKNAIIQGNTCI